MKRSNTITAVLFLVFLAAMALLTCLGVPDIWSDLAEGWRGRTDTSDSSLTAKAVYVTENTESALNEALDSSHLFIQLYGGVQRLAGRRMVSDVSSDNTVTKLSTGALTFCGLDNQYAPPTAQAENTAALAQYLEELGVPFLAVTAPEKIPPDSDQLPAGVNEYGNDYADAFLDLASQAGVDTFDLRPAFLESGRWEDLFFVTDHHWNADGAFLAYQTLAAELEERYGFSTDPAYTDPDSYERTVYEDLFLGSQGKRVGSLYAGADDITLYTPLFDTNLTYACEAYGFSRTGPFETSVCFPERVAERDWFNGNPYTYYSGGDYPIAAITNHNNPDGPRIVMLRDSFACALAPFLSLSCSELITIDLRHFDGDLMETIGAYDPDLVLTLYTASTTGLENMFQFDKTEG